MDQSVVCSLRSNCRIPCHSFTCHRIRRTFLVGDELCSLLIMWHTLGQRGYRYKTSSNNINRDSGIEFPKLGIPVILLSLTRCSKEFEKKGCSSKTFGFFSNKLLLEREISAFFIAYFVLSESNSSVRIISISVDNDFSPLRRYIFKRRNLFVKYLNKHENRLYRREKFPHSPILSGDTLNNKPPYIYA